MCVIRSLLSTRMVGESAWPSGAHALTFPYWISLPSFTVKHQTHSGALIPADLIGFTQHPIRAKAVLENHILI